MFLTEIFIFKAVMWVIFVDGLFIIHSYFPGLRMHEAPGLCWAPCIQRWIEGSQFEHSCPTWMSGGSEGFVKLPAGCWGGAHMFLGERWGSIGHSETGWFWRPMWGSIAYGLVLNLAADYVPIFRPSRGWFRVPTGPRVAMGMSLL